MLSRKPCNAVLFSVSFHASEFIDLEHLAVTGEPVLSVEHGTAVIQLDAQSGYEHYGRCYNATQRRKHYIKGTLDDKRLGGKSRISAYKKRRIEQMYLLSTSDNDIRKLGSDVCALGVRKAYFQDIVLPLAGNIADDNSVIGNYKLGNKADILIAAYGTADHEPVLTEAHFFNKSHRLPASVDYHHFLGRIKL